MLTSFFNSSIGSLTISDVFVIVLFTLALILTIVSGVIIVSVKVKRINIKLRKNQSIQTLNERIIQNRLDLILHKLNKAPSFQISSKDNILPESLQNNTSIRQNIDTLVERNKPEAALPPLNNNMVTEKNDVDVVYSSGSAQKDIISEEIPEVEESPMTNTDKVEADEYIIEEGTREEKIIDILAEAGNSDLPMSNHSNQEDIKNSTPATTEREAINIDQLMADCTLFSEGEKEQIKKYIDPISHNIYCVVRNIYVPLSKKELCRQLYINRLIYNYNYASRQLRIDLPLSINKETTNIFITVLDDNNLPYILVHYTEDINKVENFLQYSKDKNVSYFALINNKEEAFYEQHSDNTFTKIMALPKNSKVLEDSKKDQFTTAENITRQGVRYKYEDDNYNEVIKTEPNSFAVSETPSVTEEQSVTNNNKYQEIMNKYSSSKSLSGNPYIASSYKVLGTRTENPAASPSSTILTANPRSIQKYTPPIINNNSYMNSSNRYAASNSSTSNKFSVNNKTLPLKSSNINRVAPMNSANLKFSLERNVDSNDPLALVKSKLTSENRYYNHLLEKKLQSSNRSEMPNLNKAPLITPKASYTTPKRNPVFTTTTSKPGSFNKQPPRSGKLSYNAKSYNPNTGSSFFANKDNSNLNFNGGFKSVQTFSSFQDRNNLNNRMGLKK